jgi:hypothetical protein
METIAASENVDEMYTLMVAHKSLFDLFFFEYKYAVKKHLPELIKLAAYKKLIQNGKVVLKSQEQQKMDTKVLQKLLEISDLTSYEANKIAGLIHEKDHGNIDAILSSIQWSNKRQRTH